MFDELIDFVNMNGGPMWLMVIGFVLLMLGINQLKQNKKKIDFSEFYFDPQTQGKEEDLSGRSVDDLSGRKADDAYGALLEEDKKKYDELMNFSFNYNDPGKPYEEPDPINNTTDDIVVESKSTSDIYGVKRNPAIGLFYLDTNVDLKR